MPNIANISNNILTDSGVATSSLQPTITLTTTGTSGASTLISNTLNIPNYGSALTGYVPTSRQLTINGTAYDLSADRTWSVGTVTSVAALTLGTTGTDLSSSVATGTTTPVITLNVPTASAANRGALSSADWSTFNTKVGGVTATSPLFSSGGSTPNITIQQSSGSQDGYLSSTDWTTFNNKQASGNYITSLTGEATATGPGAAAVTLDNASVTAKILTGVNITGGTVLATDTMLTAFGKLQNQVNGLIGGSIYQGTWNAATNTPTLTSSVGTQGYYYIVSVAGTTNLDGITDWFVGDWAIFNGGVWQQVDNTDAVVSVNGQTGAVSLTTDNISEGVTNLYYTDTRARAALSFAAGSGAYNSTTGVITIPTNTSQLTNGANFITLASLSGTAPISYNSGTGAISITQSGTASNGYLSSTDWNTFNNKQATISLTTTGTSGAATLVGATLNIPNYGSALSGYLPLTGGTLTGPLLGTSASFSSSVNGSLFSVVPSTNYNAQFDYTGGTRISQTTPATEGTDSMTFVINGGSTSTTGNAFIFKTQTGNTTPTAVLTILKTGNVGIGTNTPSACLNVSNVPTSYFGIIETTGTSAGTVKHFRLHKPGYVEYGIGILADDSFHISTASTFPTTNGFTFTSGGNVIIGTNNISTGHRLTVYSATATAQIRAAGAAPAILFTNTDTNTNSYSGYVGIATAVNNFMAGTAAGDMVVQNYSGYPILFGIGNVIKMRIEASGQLVLTSTISNGTYTYTLPSATGTLALTSDIPSLANYVTLNTIQTITAEKIFSSTLKSDNYGILLRNNGGYASGAGYTTIGGISNGLKIVLDTASIHNLQFSTSASYNYTFPSATGTLALTSDLGSYLPLTGGTLTGALGGTSAIFSSTIQGTIITATSYFKSDTYRDSRAETLISYQGSNNIRLGSGVGSDYLTFLAGGTLKATLDASGNLGLGVTPSAWESGYTVVQQNAKYFNAADGSANYQGINAYNNSGWKYIASGTAQYLQQFNGGFTFFNAASGTAGAAITWATLLTIASTGAATFSSSVTQKDFHQVYAGAGNIVSAISWQGTDNGFMNIYSGGVIKNRISSSGDSYFNGGNVGIGTSSSAAILRPLNIKPATDIPQLYLVQSNNDAGGWMMRAGVDGHYHLISYQGSESEKLTIRYDTGNVLIGTTTATSQKLTVNSATAAGQVRITGAAPTVYFTDTVTDPANYVGLVGLATATNNFFTGTAAGDFVMYNQVNGYKLFVVNYSGGVYLTSGATSWTANSDIRLKNINSHIENAVEKLSTLQTINFSYKDDKFKKQNLGLIAQEVEKIFPELIDKNNDGMLGVRYTELVPVLIKAIQELKLEIETLKNK